MDVKSREEIIKFAQKLNSTNLSPLRSGNISLKAQNNKEEGFLITPSKYITSLITEKGICEASEKGLKNLFK